MYILQVSDLHILSNSKIDEYNKKIDILINDLSRFIPSGSDVVCCVLGDIVDRGNKDAYIQAKLILEYFFTRLKNIFGEENVEFEIVPGNHDLCEDTLLSFNQFATELLGRNVEYTDEKSMYVSNHFGYQFVSISSILDKECKFGQVDFDTLSSDIIPSNSIFLTHHALISGDKDDSAVIRNGYEFQKKLEDKNAICLLHGHTHGCKRYVIGNDCQIIGVASFLKNYVQDVSNQCNLVQIKGRYVNRIETFLYQGDRKKWDRTIIYEKETNNHYNGESVSAVYDKVLIDAEANLLLPNVCIQVKQNYDKFKEEIENRFNSIIEDAKVWQEKDCPDCLDYTHGQLMSHGSISWDRHIIETLKRNPTSKRAIIPLIDKEMAFKGGDGKLVSFDLVQFGFGSDDCNDLHITVYFRALEIKQFLPINLCEIYLMAERIRSEIRAIQNITVCIFAFKAEAKTNYGCYKKSQLDIITESKLCKLVNDKSWDDIRLLLDEKAKMGDTVIDLAWLKKLQNVFDEFYNGNNAEKVKSQICTVEEKLLVLRDERERCSIYSKTQIQENDFVFELQKLAEIIGESRDE